MTITITVFPVHHCLSVPQNLAKLGVQQSNNPLAALGSILKRNSSGRGSFAKKSPKKTMPGSPISTPKSKKKNVLDVPPSTVTARLGSEPPQSALPKSPKGFLRGLRRSSSKNKKKGEGNGVDDQSETSSIVSLPIHSTVNETSESLSTTPISSPSKSIGSAAVVSPPSSSSDDNIPAHNGGFLPGLTSSPQLVPLRDKPPTASKTSPSHRKTTDSAVFKEGTYEHLFGQSSNLFDSRELDALLGKKDKTPERILEEEKKTGKDTPDVAASPTAVTPSQKGNSYLSGSRSVSVLSKSEKRNLDSSRSGIRANLHRYESNSYVSKTDSSQASDVIIKEEDSDVSVGVAKKTTTSPGENSKTALLFEDCGDELFGPLETAEKKAPAKEAADIKKARLFDDDDLFAEKSVKPAKKEMTPDDDLFAEKSTKTAKKKVMLDDDLFAEKVNKTSYERSGTR